MVVTARQIIVALAMLASVGLVYFALFGPDGDVTWNNYSRILKGMTYSEVKAILGRPQPRFTKGIDILAKPPMLAVFEGEDEAILRGMSKEAEVWSGSMRRAIAVIFSRDQAIWKAYRGLETDFSTEELEAIQAVLEERETTQPSGVQSTHSSLHKLPDSIASFGAIVLYRSVPPESDQFLVTSENYASISLGMTSHEVQAFLGPPTETMNQSGGTPITTFWRDGSMTLIPSGSLSSYTRDLLDSGQLILVSQGDQPIKLKGHQRIKLPGSQRIKLPGSQSTRWKFKLVGDGMIWAGLEFRRITVVFDGDTVVYKSYLRPSE